MIEPTPVTLAIKRTKDTSGFEFSYGAGGAYSNFALAKQAAAKSQKVNPSPEDSITQTTADYKYSYGSGATATYEYEYQARAAAIADGYTAARDLNILVGKAGTKIAFLYNGETYDTKTDARRAARWDAQNPYAKLVGKAVPVSDDIVFTFQTNPASLSITAPTTLIKNEFIGLDGGVIIPSQLGILSIAGDGTFVSSDDTLPIEQWEEIKKAQNKKEILRFTSDVISTNVVIESLTLNNTSSTNSLSFSFSLIETQIVDTGKSGFAYDRRKRRKRNMAIEGITSSDSVVAKVAAYTTSVAAEAPEEVQEVVKENTELNFDSVFFPDAVSEMKIWKPPTPSYPANAYGPFIPKGYVDEPTFL